MNKIKTEIRYKEMRFNHEGEINGIRLLINTDSTYCIIVNKQDDVLFEITVDQGQSGAYISDIIINN